MDRFAQAFWAGLLPYADMMAPIVVFLVFIGGMALVERIERK